MQRWWFEEQVVGPVRDLLGDLAPGSVLTDAPRAVAWAVEGLFRVVVPEQWERWWDAMTDGVVIDLAWRPSATTMAVAGRMGTDFAGHVAPVMAVFTLAEGGVSARVHVGEVDPRTGGLPSLDRDCLILDGGDGETGVVPHRTAGRRLVPLEWTEVAVVGPGDLEG